MRKKYKRRKSVLFYIMIVVMLVIFNSILWRIFDVKLLKQIAGVGLVAVVVVILKILERRGRGGMLYRILDSEKSRIMLRDINIEGNILRYMKAEYHIRETGETYLVKGLLDLDNMDNLKMWYMDFIAKRIITEGIKDILILGGGAYILPGWIADNCGWINQDVVENDEGITEIAKDHFYLEEENRMNIYHGDGKRYLEKSEKKYDLIIQDTYMGEEEYDSSEYFELVRKNLKESGIYVLKTGAREKLEYVCDKFGEVFKEVYMVRYGHDRESGGTNGNREGLILVNRDTGYGENMERKN